MAKSLIDTIDNTPFMGLSITNVHTGFNVSIEFERGEWSPPVFATSPSEAILKAIRLHATKWDGVCACGKTEADGVRCSLGATHSAPPLAPLPPLPDLTPSALPPLPY